MPALNNHYVVTHPPTSVDVTSNGNMLLTPDLRDVALLPCFMLHMQEELMLPCNNSTNGAET